MNELYELELHKLKKDHLNKMKDERKKYERNKRIRRGISKGMFVISLIAFAISISTLDSDSWKPAVVLIISLLYMFLYSKVSS